MNSHETVKRHAGWFTALGIALILLGAIAIITAVVTTLISVIFFGWLLVIGGIFKAIHALRVRSWGGLLLQMFLGILNFFVGLLIIANPAASAQALTLMMAAFFIVGGVFRIVSAAEQHFPGRTWALLNGFINIILGALIWAQWPGSAFWIIGMFIGIDLLFTGSWLLMVSMTARRGISDQPATTAPA